MREERDSISNSFESRNLFDSHDVINTTNVVNTAVQFEPNNPITELYVNSVTEIPDNLRIIGSEISEWDFGSQLHHVIDCVSEEGARFRFHVPVRDDSSLNEDVGELAEETMEETSEGENNETPMYITSVGQIPAGVIICEVHANEINSDGYVERILYRGIDAEGNTREYILLCGDDGEHGVDTSEESTSGHLHADISHIDDSITLGRNGGYTIRNGADGSTITISDNGAYVTNMARDDSFARLCADRVCNIQQACARKRVRGNRKCDENGLYEPAQSYDIYRYHQFDNWRKQVVKGQEPTNTFYGIELEVENVAREHENRRVAYSLCKRLKHKVTCSRDGSIENGFEIVSQPCSWEYLKHNEEAIKSALAWLVGLGFRGDNVKTCGLHVHISRQAFGETREEQDKKINMLILFFETYRKEIVAFSRRNSEQVRRWARFFGDNDEDGIDLKKARSLKYIDAKKSDVDRYQAVNLHKGATVELRIFKSTLNPNTFMATLEFVNSLVNVIKEANSIADISWSKVINYPGNVYLKDYAKTRKCLGSRSKYMDMSDKFFNEKSLLRYRKKAFKDFQTQVYRRYEILTEALDEFKSRHDFDEHTKALIECVKNTFNEFDLYCKVVSSDFDRHLSSDNCNKTINLCRGMIENLVNDWRRIKNEAPYYDQFSFLFYSNSPYIEVFKRVNEFLNHFHDLYQDCYCETKELI